jgi:hypothetical protein
MIIIASLLTDRLKLLLLLLAVVIVSLMDVRDGGSIGMSCGME